MNLISKYIVGLIKAEGREAFSVKFTNYEVKVIVGNIQDSLTNEPLDISLVGSDQLGLHDYIFDIVTNVLGELGYPSVTVVKTTGSASTRNLEFYSEELDAIILELRYKIGEPIPQCLSKYSALKKPNRFARLRRDELQRVYEYIIPFEEVVGKLSPDLVLGNFTEEEKEKRLLEISRRSKDREGEKRLFVINGHSTSDSSQKQTLEINKSSRVEDTSKLQRSSIFSTKGE